LLALEYPLDREPGLLWLLLGRYQSSGLDPWPWIASSDDIFWPILKSLCSLFVVGGGSGVAVVEEDEEEKGV
jgi:hypothetical protein